MLAHMYIRLRFMDSETVQPIAMKISSTLTTLL